MFCQFQIPHTKVDQHLGAQSYCISWGPSKDQQPESHSSCTWDITDYKFPKWDLAASAEFLLLCLTQLKTKIMFWEAPLKRLLILDFQLVLYHRITEWSELEGTQKDHRIQPLSKWPIWGLNPQLWCYSCIASREDREVKKCHHSFFK